MKLSPALSSQLQTQIEHSFIPLTQVEQVSLAILAQRGDLRAKGLLVKNQSKNLYERVYAFAKNESQLDDLIGEGVLGIYQAIKHFDVEGAASFDEVASLWVHASLIRIANLRT